MPVISQVIEKKEDRRELRDGVIETGRDKASQWHSQRPAVVTPSDITIVTADE
jgi:hypothetical protein